MQFSRIKAHRPTDQCDLDLVAIGHHGTDTLPEIF